MELGKFLIIILIILAVCYIVNRILKLISYLSDNEKEMTMIEHKHKDKDFWNDRGDPDD